MLRHRKIISAMMLTLGLGAIVMLSGCVKTLKAPEVPSGIQREPQHEAEINLTHSQAQELGLRTAMVKHIPFAQQVISSGQVEASTYLQGHVFATAPGKALDVLVIVGQVVKPGQVLATMKSDQIGQMESDLLTQDLQNQAAIRQAKAQLDFSTSEYQRELILYQKKVSAQIDYETARTQYIKDKATLEDTQTQRQATIDTANRRLALYGVGPHVAEAVIKSREINPYLTIRAPRGGVVIARNLNNGEMIDPAKEIFTIADLHKIWLAGNIYETDLIKVHPGQAIDVTLDSLPGKHFSGRLNFVSRVLDPNSRTIEARGEVENPEELLRPNMFARMAIRIGDQSTLAVPSSAIQTRGDSTIVYVQIKPDVFVERRIKIGVDNGKYTQVLQGLMPNEIVATSGTMAIQGKLLKSTQ